MPKVARTLAVAALAVVLCAVGAPLAQAAHGPVARTTSGIGWD